ncbi:hypothetical protein V2E25_01575 [Mycoplasmopsis arginini]|uniref:Uncharacterized protein n=1 Tax=Mycoplasmopsis arginini TaxID=2094 RepID=A0ABZ2AJJ0_MYCAR|nr:hypothetical protein [Mycoplasmopsis arginini]WVN22264.1 hypothetical protein V2E25_01575 [Mycoplasmopsis arginini]VEU81672.1 Uncharacterised protein [Mycoplasmopsis arginini]
MIFKCKTIKSFDLYEYDYKNDKEIEPEITLGELKNAVDFQITSEIQRFGSRAQTKTLEAFNELISNIIKYYDEYKKIDGKTVVVDEDFATSKLWTNNLENAMAVYGDEYDYLREKEIYDLNYYYYKFNSHTSTLEDIAKYEIDKELEETFESLITNVFYKKIENQDTDESKLIM